MTGFATPEFTKSPTGSRLCLRVARPRGPARAIVHINHGLAEHSARYGRFAEALREAGFATYAHDHRGHGQTTAPGAPLGHFGPGAGLETLLDDMAAVQIRIRRDHPETPLILFGHSMGGMLAMNFALRHADTTEGNLAGTAIWNAPFATRAEALVGKAILAWERFRRGSDVPSRFLPKLAQKRWARAIPDRRTDFDWLSRDKAEVDAFIADPRCGFDVSIGVWLTLMEASLDMVVSNGRDNVPHHLPFHLVGGGADPSTGDGKAVRTLEKRLRRNGFLNLETRIYPQNRHESLNELNRDEMTRHFIAWVENIIN